MLRMAPSEYGIRPASCLIERYSGAGRASMELLSTPAGEYGTPHASHAHHARVQSARSLTTAWAQERRFIVRTERDVQNARRLPSAGASSGCKKARAPRDRSS